MHLSKSKIGLYQRCAFAYYCRYIEGLKIPPTSAMFCGRCFDTAVNYNYLNKIVSGKDENVSAVKDVLNDEFKKGSEEVMFKEGEKPDALKDGAIDTVGVFHKEICAKVKPKDVQIRDEIKFANVPYSLVVVLDLIDSEETIIDNKLARKTWSAGKEIQMLDPIIYTMWYEWKHGKPPKGFRFDIGVALKKPKTEQRTVTISDTYKRSFARYLATVYDSIMHDTARGVFLPRTDNMLCSRKFCGFWKECEAYWHHTIKE